MAQVRRIRRTPQQWAKIIGQFSSGDQSQSAFCAEHGLASTTFEKYLRRFGSAGKRRGDKFCDVTPRTPRVARVQSPGMVVHAGGGISVQCSATMSVSSVAQLVRVLRGRILDDGNLIRANADRSRHLGSNGLGIHWSS